VSGWSLVRESGGEIQSESRMRVIRMSRFDERDGKRSGALRQRSRPSSTLPVPTIRFQILYVFLVLAHERRRIVHFAVTRHPTAEWTVQQLREAFRWDSSPRYLLRDRDRVFGQKFVQQVKVMGIKQVLSAPRSPWQRAYVERFIGSIRRECLDHVIVFGEQSLQRALKTYVAYDWRTHLSLGKDAPRGRPIQSPEEGNVVEIREVGGLHHHYERRAA
jgi:putative transposase